MIFLFVVLNSSSSGCVCAFFFSSRRRHTRFDCDWSSDVCSSDLNVLAISGMPLAFWSRTNELNVHFSVGVYAEVPVFLSGSDYHTGWANRALLHREIGRASCRERV